MAAGARAACAARVSAVTKEYALGSTTVRALSGVDLELASGSFAVIHGPSGSGKSTLLHLLGCLDRATSGAIEIGGQDVSALDDRQRTDFRAFHIGFVFQNFNLISTLDALENVEYPLQLAVPERHARHRRALEALELVGLGGAARRRPSELSGGERQRVAFARAVVKRPQLILADEPTANLDRRTSAQLLELMRRIQRDNGATVIVSSHDPEIVQSADARIRIEDGRVVTPS